ncbi:hypothetical protein ABT340_08755 [Streptosporangium sp. NPDC000239]|uniref:hypothetical protein n=1 Tax=Streptosporangium sp. NPDC000239 TaxID=3154248 RepID=UPI003330C390
MAYTIQGPRPDHLATTGYSFDRTLGGRTVPMGFRRKSLHAVTDAFTNAGSRLSVIR